MYVCALCVCLVLKEVRRGGAVKDGCEDRPWWCTLILAEEASDLGEVGVSLVYRVSAAQPGLHKETLFPKNKMMVVSHLVDAGNQMQVLCKSNKCSERLSLLSSPSCFETGPHDVLSD